MESEICSTCASLNEWFLNNNHETKCQVVCEKCIEEMGIVPLHLPYEPKIRIKFEGSYFIEKFYY